MKQRIIFFLVGFFVTISAFSQNDEALEKSDSLFKLSMKLCKAGNYTEAIRLGTEAKNIWEKVLGKEHPAYALSVNNLASYNAYMGNYSEAIRLGTEALQIREKILGREHPNYVNSLSNLAGYYYEMGNYTEAISLGTEALQIRERILGKEHPSYALSLNNLASYNSSLGNYAEAVRLGVEALQIREKILGKEHPDYAQSLSNLASYNAYIGNYSEAIKLGTEVTEIFENTLGKEHPYYATSLCNLASYNSSLGNYSKAIKLGTEAIKIREKILGKEHHDYATSLNNLALYNSLMGNYAEAINMGTEVLEIQEKTLGKEHPNYATSLNNLAGYYSHIGNSSEAIRLGMEASEIQERVLGKEHPDYATSLNNLAYYNFNIGNYAEAIRLGTEASEIQERVLGKEHPDYVISLSNLALCNFLEGNYDEVLYYVIKSERIESKIIRNTFSYLTSHERNLFWNKYRNCFEKYLPELTFYIQNDSLTATTYDGILLSKGLLLNSEMEMSKLLLESEDTVVVDKYKSLQTNRMMVNKLQENGYAKLKSITDTLERKKYHTEMRMVTDSLERVLQSQEEELLQLSKTYGDYTKNLSINWKQVREKLGEKDVAIEFLNFGARNDSIMYIALTLTKEDDVPHLIPLFEKSELDNLSNRDYYTTCELSNLIWKPLAEVLAGKENIYFAPAGNLHNIAIESIPCYDGEGLMSDRWNLYRLSSTRELALIKDKNELKDAYVYGNLNYDMDVDALENNDKKFGNGKRSVDWETVNIADSLDLRGALQQILSPLPGTKLEVENIDSSLKSQHVNSMLLTDTLGTEASLKALSGQRPSVLHVATHGFYWSESEAKKFDLASMAMLNDDSNNDNKYVEDKALTRSGLFFAGASNAFREDTKLPEGVDDGILTAKEISVLDLRGLDLVVLSACETGLGEITGDGVFGLQRGFKKAGAQTLMMSLWKVDDTATQMLMSEFYSNLAKGENKFEALKEAQEFVRTTDNGKYDDPRYWAAFILLDAIN